MKAATGAGIPELDRFVSAAAAKEIPAKTAHGSDPIGVSGEGVDAVFGPGAP